MKARYGIFYMIDLFGLSINFLLLLHYLIKVLKEGKTIYTNILLGKIGVKDVCKKDNIHLLSRLKMLSIYTLFS